MNYAADMLSRLPTAPVLNRVFANHPGSGLALDCQVPVLTHFGDMIDVRKRGALRLNRMAGGPREVDTPAVVRVWHDDTCRELSAHQARALANHLLAAADLVDSQNQRLPTPQ